MCERLSRRAGCSEHPPLVHFEEETVVAAPTLQHGRLDHGPTGKPSRPRLQRFVREPRAQQTTARVPEGGVLRPTQLRRERPQTGGAGERRRRWWRRAKGARERARGGEREAARRSALAPPATAAARSLGARRPQENQRRESVQRRDGIGDGSEVRQRRCRLFADMVSSHACVVRY